MTESRKITPALWFDNNLGEALAYYATVFKNMSVNGRAVMESFGMLPEQAPGKPTEQVHSATFEIEGQAFQAFNGGPMYKFSEAISFSIACDTQAEIDHYWDKLSAGGVVQQCGWLKDKFGVSWQVVPRELSSWIADDDRTKAQRALEAMMQMQKFDIAAMKAAHAGA